MTDPVEINRRRARLLLARAAVPVTVALAIVLAAAAWLVGGGVLGVLVAVAVAAAVGATAARSAWTGSHRVALAATGARPIGPDEQPRLRNTVAGLATTVGIPEPALWIVDDDAADACAVARSIDSAAVVVTSGLMGGLTLIELEAVLARELSRVRRGDAAVGALAVTCLGGLDAMRGPGPADEIPSATEGPTPSFGPAKLALPILLAAPLTRRLVAASGDGPLDPEADLAAVEVTRYPPGLATALEKRMADAVPVRRASPVVAHLWMAGPPVEGPWREALATIYAAPRTLAERVEALREL